MTLDEAIKHAEEVSDKKDREKQKWERWLENDSDYRAVAEKVSCELCAEEHRQLTEWLKDYKRLLEQEPCDDVISRQAVLEAIRKCHCEEWVKAEIGAPIEALPSVTPAEKVGHWTITGTEPTVYKCSECGEICCCQGRYCNECGAKMEEQS